MKLSAYEEAHDFMFETWLVRNLPDLTQHQKDTIKPALKSSEFKVVKLSRKVENIFLRISIIFIIPVMIVLFILLPVNFIITGRWGYQLTSKVGVAKLFNRWMYSCGF